MIRVGVIGAAGRMGLMVCRAVADADDLALVAAIDRSKVGQNEGALIGHSEIAVPISDELDRLLEAEAEVAIDFTHPDVAMDNIRFCIDHAIHLVVGTSGISQEDLQEIERMLRDERLVVMLDWDLAGPGSRLWDIAYAAYTFVPIAVMVVYLLVAKRLGAFESL